MEAAIFLGLATIIGFSAGLFDFSEDEPEPPVADDDTASTTEDTPVSIDVLANDEDPDGDALSVTSASALNGSVVIEADDRLSYTPNPDFSGTDWIRYGVEDGDGDSDDAVVTVNVTAANDLPVANDDSTSTVEDTLVTINVLGNDSDVDGDPLTVTSATATNGSVTIGAGGSLTYTPNADFTGTDTISYTISDGAGGTASASVAVIVAAVNDAPVAVDDTATTVEDTPVTFSVLGNDSDVDGDPLTVTSASATNGSVAIGAGGSLTYTPNADFSGTDTITYDVSDGAGGTATGSVAVTVGAANDAPVAVADTATTAEDTPVTIDVLGNDP
ncbi:MAG: Ig-like domain-containing protein, partial [Pelagibaca sp.]